MILPSLARRGALLSILSATAMGGRAAAQGPSPSTGQRPAIRALAFDGFTLLDPRAVSAAVVQLLPEKGVQLAAAWANKLFALSWLETSAGRYSGFSALADAALDFSAQAMGIDLSPSQRQALVAVYGRLPVWPDTAATLEALHKAGVRLAFLSNLGSGLLQGNMRSNGLDQWMDPPLSTDQVRAFKPSPRAYAMAERHFGLPRDEIGFVAFGGWDALGASWYGYRTAWINRLGVTGETLVPRAYATARDLSAIASLRQF